MLDDYLPERELCECGHIADEHAGTSDEARNVGECEAWTGLSRRCPCVTFDGTGEFEGGDHADA